MTYQQAPGQQAQPSPQQPQSAGEHQQAAPRQDQPQQTAWASSDPMAAQAYPPQPVREPSSFSLAWNDLKHTPNAAANLGFKSLVYFVPILNFCVYGVGGKWAQQIADNVNEPLPKETVNSRNFTTGFFYFAICLILGFLLGIVNIIPILGQIVFFIGMFFVPSLSYVMFQRYIAYGSFGEAFAIGDIIEKMKRNFGDLWVATFVPALITGLIGGGLSLLFMGMFGGAGLMGLFYGVSTGSLAAFITSLFSFGIAGVVAMAIMAVVDAIGTLWGMRGAGWWIRRNVPEWATTYAMAAKAQKQAEEQARAAQVYAEAQMRQQQYQQQAWAAQQQAAQYQQAYSQQQPQPTWNNTPATDGYVQAPIAGAGTPPAQQSGYINQNVQAQQSIQPGSGAIPMPDVPSEIVESAENIEEVAVYEDGSVPEIEEIIEEVTEELAEEEKNAGNKK